MTSHDVVINEARETLARCLTTDSQILEATRAIGSVNEKVRRKERASREDKLIKDKLANRERANKRRGLPNPVSAVVRPSDKSFRPRPAPKQGKGPRHNPNQANQRPSPRDANSNPSGQRRTQGRDQDERTPRPRGQARQSGPNNQNQVRSQVRNTPDLRPDQTSQIERFMKEIKKLMRK
jgi:hypothetical protein